MQEIRTLGASEIEVRVGHQVGNSHVLLLYKNARVDMNILDELYPERWQRKHLIINNNMYCSIGVYFVDIGWVWREDCGTKSRTEGEKGEASDSFKRAAVNWGIGRELYTAPVIKIPNQDLGMYENKKGNLVTYDEIIVSEVEYDDKREIIKLTVRNKTKNKEIYKYPNIRLSDDKATDICPKCGEKAKGYTSKTNKFIDPVAEIKTLGGMCKDCYKASDV